MEQDERECPFCFEIVKARAIKCKHCHSEIEPLQNTPRPPVDTSQDKSELVTAKLAIGDSWKNTQQEKHADPIRHDDVAGRQIGSPVGSVTAPPGQIASAQISSDIKALAIVMFICMICAWVLLAAPVPFTLFISIPFNLAALILAIFCLTRSKVLLGVIGLLGCIIGSILAYIIGLSLMIGAGATILTTDTSSSNQQSPRPQTTSAPQPSRTPAAAPQSPKVPEESNSFARSIQSESYYLGSWRADSQFGEVGLRFDANTGNKVTGFCFDPGDFTRKKRFTGILTPNDKNGWEAMLSFEQAGVSQRNAANKTSEIILPDNRSATYHIKMDNDELVGKSGGIALTLEKTGTWVFT